MTKNERNSVKSNLKQEIIDVDRIGFWNGAGWGFVVLSLAGYMYGAVPAGDLLYAGLVMGVFFIAIGMTLRQPHLR